MKTILSVLAMLAVPSAAFAVSGSGEPLVLTGSFYGYLSIAIFVAAYSLVPLENNIHMRKSKPVLIAAGIIWILVALAFRDLGELGRAHDAIKHGLVEYAELFLFLLAALPPVEASDPPDSAINPASGAIESAYSAWTGSQRDIRYLIQQDSQRTSETVSADPDDDRAFSGDIPKQGE